MFDKKIFVHDLKPGMFVSALDRPWLDTPFLLQGFLVETDEDVAELRRACRYVYIDLARSIGGDLELEYALAKKGAGGQDEQRVVEVAVSGNMRSHADVSDARPAATAKSSRLSKNATTQPNVINPRPTAASHKPVTTAPLASAAAGLRGNHRATDDAPSSATKQLPNQAQNRSIGNGKPAHADASGRIGSRFGWLDSIVEWFGRPGPPDFDDITLDAPAPRYSAGPLVIYRETETLKAEIPQARQALDRSVTVIRDVVKQLETGGTLQIEKAEDVMREMIDSMTRNPNAMLWLSRMRNERENAYSQSLQTAVYMVSLGMHLGLNQDDVTNLAVSGLMLDIGKLKVPKELLERNGKLSAPEFDCVKEHVGHSLTALRENPSVHTKVLETVARHHEREDGSGYPYGLRGESIGLFGRIAGIVDAFTAMTNMRTYAETLSMHDAIRSLYRWKGTQFHEPLVEQFVQAIGVFPVGSMVELSSGEIAIVVSHNRVRRIKPRVLLLTGPDKTRLSKPTQLDLLYAPEQPNGAELAIATALPAGAHGIDPREYFMQ